MNTKWKYYLANAVRFYDHTTGVPTSAGIQVVVARKEGRTWVFDGEWLAVNWPNVTNDARQISKLQALIITGSQGPQEDD